MRFLHRLIPLVLLTLAACSSETTATSVADTVPTPTSTTTTTTATITTTTTVPTSTTGSPSRAGDPTATLESFVSELQIVFDLPDSPITISTESTYAQGSIECASNIDFAVLSFASGAISTPDGVWIDQGDGQGMLESTPGELESLGIFETCPAAPSFWVDFSELALAANAVKQRTSEVRNGIEVEKADITPAIGQLRSLGFITSEDLEGLTINQFVVWMSQDGWIAGIAIDALADPASLADDFEGLVVGEQPVPFTFTLDITRPNDPALEVTPPI